MGVAWLLRLHPMPAVLCFLTLLVLAVEPALATPAALAARSDQAAPADENDPRALFARAVAAQQAGEPEEAAALYERVIVQVGPDPRLLSNLAAAYASLGRYDDAILRYREALEHDPTKAPIRLNLAFALYKAGRISEAADEAAPVAAADTSNHRAVLFLADCYLRLGRGADVVRLLDPLVLDYADEPAFSYLLGMALLGEGETARAQLLIDRVLAGESPEAHVMLAFTQQRRGDCDAALEQLDLARAANPRLPTASFLRGQCLMARNDWAGAEAAFRDEIAIDPNHFEAHLLLAGLLHDAGRKEEALEHAKRAHALRPADPAAQLALGRLELGLGRADEALPFLEAAGEAFPDDKKTHLELAVAYFRLGRPEDAARQREVVERIESEAQARASAGGRDAVSRTLGAVEEAPPPPPE